MLNSGDRFGDYTVVRLLGQGGMGSVFLLENATGGQVAAKILDPATAGDHEARRRFLREAQLALGIEHPNLVQTYDVGEDPDTGLCYILMEYVPGGSLADRIKTGPLPINDAIRITYQIASVLELARQKGIVHRDIKPGNIMFGADGKAKLADLGIARGGIGGTETTTVTQTGMMIGTPAYMAPEQMLDAHNVDSRADIYSLGIVFYEMLTGERPNKDDTIVQLMAKAVTGEPIPDVRAIRPEVSVAIAGLVNLMCAMKADERISTPAEVTMAISQIVHGHDVTIVKKRPSVVANKPTKSGGGSSHAVVMVVFGLAVVVGIAAFVYFGLRRNQTAVTTSSERQSAARPVNALVVTQTNVIEKVVEKVVEHTHVVTNVVRSAVPIASADADRLGPVSSTSSSNLPDCRENKTSAGHDPIQTQDDGWANLPIRCAKVGNRNWFYKLNKSGDAALWRKQNGNNNEPMPCVDPAPDGAIRIPSELDGHKVTVIGSLAFVQCREITSVAIPNGVREIDNWAFNDCVKLVEVNIPDTVETIKYGAFCFCRSLRSIDIGKCPDILGSAFWACHLLDEVRVSPDNPSYVFRDGMLLSRDGSTLVFHSRTRATVDWPRNLKEIGEGAFLGCRARELDIPDSVERIGKYAFFVCYALERIGFGSGLREIGDRAFRLCDHLRELDFPKSLVRMGESVVDGCSSLNRVVFRGDAPMLDLGCVSVMGKMPSGVEILVAPGSKGWNGPGSTDLPKMWPPGNSEDSRPIRYMYESSIKVESSGEKFDWNKMFPCNVPIGEELQKAGRKPLSHEVREKADKLVAVVIALQKAADAVKKAQTAIAASTAISQLERQISQYQRIKVSATGKYKLKAWESQNEVCTVAHAKVKLLEYLLYVEVEDGPAHERLKRLLKYASDDFESQKKKLIKMKRQDGVQF